MYKLFSPQLIINNLLTLALPFITDKNKLDQIILKQAYRDYLAQLQPHCPYIYDSNIFHCSTEVENAFGDYFINEEVELRLAEEKKIPLDKVLYPKTQERKMILENSLNDLSKIDPTFTDLFKLVMNTVFCTTSQRRGGTSVNPRFIGVMCAYHDMNAEKAAIPESFIHEFTHNALFLDELCYQHYHYPTMKNPAALADIHYDGFEYKISFHRCLHSLIVSAEILLARDEFIGHDRKITQHLPSVKMVERAKIYIQSMRANPFFDTVSTPRAKELFAKCEEFYRLRVTA